MSTEIVEATNENKCSIKCCPKRNICLSCGKFDITWKILFSFQIIFSVILHIFDVGSDIYVLIDLHSKNYDYFSICLFIMILSSFFSTFTSFIDIKDNLNRNIFLNIFFCFLAVLQLGIINQTYLSIKIGKPTNFYTLTRLLEALLESCPQSLFQLFLTLKNAATYSFYEISIYYVSIIISFLNVAFALKKFEFESYKEFFENKDNEYRKDKIKVLYNCSTYGFTIILHRFTEITCRAGLLACAGYIHDGTFIINALLIEWLTSGLLTFTDKLRKYLKHYKSSGVKYCIIFSIRYLLECILFSIFNLAIYCSFYTKNLWNPESYIIHHIIRFVSNFIQLLLIIIYYSNNKVENISHFTISILSILSFTINTITLFYITKWNIKKINGTDNIHKKTIDLPCFPMKDYDEKFLQFKCISYCSKKKLLKNISSKDLNKQENKQENELVAIESIVL